MFDSHFNNLQYTTIYKQGFEQEDTSWYWANVFGYPQKSCGSCACGKAFQFKVH